MTTTPRGYFKNILAIDCETTGLCFAQANNPDVTPVFNPDTKERHQTVSWGLMVINGSTFKPLKESYIEIKWNDSSKKQRKQNPNFGAYAETIHGLTMEYLEQNGITEEDAVVEMGNIISKYWGPTSNIVTLGHNVHLFDMPFFRDLFFRHGVELKFANRHIDTNSIGFVNWETYNSDDLFDIVGQEARSTHNALDDIKRTVDVARITRKIFKKALAL